MYNHADVQYYSYVSVGGQTLSGILDTGSFDLVVFDKKCAGCGPAAKYQSTRSPTYREGGFNNKLGYGSGSVDCKQAFDIVSIGPYAGVNLTFWNVFQASMPVLAAAKFESIIGVGPPETPAYDAWAAVKDDIGQVMSTISKGSLPGNNVPPPVDMSKRAAFAVEMSHQPTLVKVDNVTYFSVCLGYKPGSSGWFTWMDTKAVDYPDLFRRVSVMGKHTWTVNMSNVHLGSSDPEVTAAFQECRSGCGAIVDSGTSLLLMPASAAQALRQAVGNGDFNCNDISSLPEFTFELDGEQFTLPPDAYVAKVTKGPHWMQKVSALERGTCQLAIMESTMRTDWGPLWILGMPFFRKYYTSFKFGASHSDRSIYVAHASTDCVPVEPTATLARAKVESIMREVDMSSVLAPPIFRRAKDNATYMEL